MKWVWFTAWFMFFATAFLAFSDSPIEAKIDSDNIALASIVPMEGDSSDMELLTRLKEQAMADCMGDSKCIEALNKLDGADIPVPEEGVSSASEGANDNGGASNGDASSSGSKGPVIASSANVQPTSSPVASSGSADQPSAGGTSSAVVASSSSKGSSVLNGACRPSTNTIERDGSVTWSYVIINGTPAQTYDWTFDEGSSIATSKDATPSVSYAAKGTYGASLVVDKGLATEKTIGCQTKLTVTGKKVSGCVCSASSSAVVVSSSKPKDVTWTVSGCTGADPFTYAWGGGLSGTGTSATKTLSSVGTYTPTLTVTNSDGETMSPTCATVTATEMPGASCKVGAHDYDANNTSMSVVPGQGFYFKPTNVTGVSGTMSMTLTGGGTTKTVSVANGSNNSATALTAPTTLGTHAYTLSVDGEEVCSANVTVEYPKVTAGSCLFKNSSNNTISTTIPGGSVTFNASSWSGWTDGMGNSVTMLLSGEGVNSEGSAGRYGNFTKSFTAPSGLGSYQYTLTYGGNQVCKASLTVDYPKPSCTIGLNTNSMGSSVSSMPGKTVVFRPGNSSFTGSISMTLTFNGSSQSITVKPDNNATTSLTVPDAVGSYPVTLSYQGNQVCSATLKAEYPAITSTSCALKNSNKSFTPGSSFSNWDANVIGQTLSMTLYLDDEEVGSGSANRYYNGDNWMSVTPPTESGTHVFRLDFHGNTVCEVEYEVD